MLQMGFIQKWLAEYLPKKDRCSSKSSNIEIENHTVNLTDMQGCFLVLIAGNFEHFFMTRRGCINTSLTFYIYYCLPVGIVASMFIILFECCCRRYKVLDETKLIKPFVK